MKILVDLYMGREKWDRAVDERRVLSRAEMLDVVQTARRTNWIDATTCLVVVRLWYYQVGLTVNQLANILVIAGRPHS